MKILKKYLLISVLGFLSCNLFCQYIDSSFFKIISRQSFYSYEKNGEFLLHVPPVLVQKNLSINVKNGRDTLTTWNGKPGKEIFRLPFSLNLSPSVYKIEAKIIITASPGVIYHASTNLVILSYKSNEVKTDRLTGGLIVNKRQFFPFGFYCYSPVYPTLPEEEVVKGFNMMSPYQKIVPETFNERKAYMDRCAELGMKVNYNLLSVSGGGGTGSKIDGLSDEEKREHV